MKLFLFSLLWGFVGMAQAQNQEARLQFQIGNKLAPQEAPAQVEVRIPEVDTAAEAAALIENQIERSSSPIVITTDQDDVLAELGRQPLKTTQDLYLAPFGSAAPAAKLPLWTKATSIAQDLSQRIQNNRIGLMILSITTAYDSFLWIHASNLSTLAKTSNVIYSIALTAIFGLDKDAWARTTRPMQNFLKKIAGYEGAQWSRRDPRDLAVRFGGNLILSLGTNLVRFSLISLDQILVGSLNVANLKYAAFLSLMGTLSSFSWSEHIALVDRRTAPAARFALERLQETRWILMGTLAASAKLLNPDVYGLWPWASLLVSSGVGMTLYLNTDVVQKWIEEKSSVLGNFFLNLGQKPLRCAKIYVI